MENRIYESPKADFQEMKLLERVADTCWGYAYAWYDYDKDGVIDVSTGEKVFLKDLPGMKENGCQGKPARDALKTYFFGKFKITLTDDDVDTNTKSKTVIPIGS